MTVGCCVLFAVGTAVAVSIASGATGAKEGSDACSAGVVMMAGGGKVGVGGTAVAVAGLTDALATGSDWQAVRTRSSAAHSKVASIRVCEQ